MHWWFGTYIWCTYTHSNRKKKKWKRLVCTETTVRGFKSQKRNPTNHKANVASAVSWSRMVQLRIFFFEGSQTYSQFDSQRKKKKKRRQVTTAWRQLLKFPKKAFEKVGRKGNYIATQKGNPTKSFQVQNYISFKCQEQGEAGVLPKSAPCIHRTKMDILMACILAQTANKKGLVQIKFVQRAAIYTYCYTYIKRLAGCGWCVAPNVIRMPNNKD